MKKSISRSKTFYFDALTANGVAVIAEVKYDFCHRVYVVTAMLKRGSYASSPFKMYFVSIDEVVEFCLSSYNNVHFSY